MFIIFWRYEVEYELELINNNYIITNSISSNTKKSKRETPAKILKRKLTFYMIIEMIYLAIHCPPFVNFNFVGSQQGDILVYS